VASPEIKFLGAKEAKMTPETKNAHRRTPDIKEIRANSFKLPVKDPLAAVADLSEDQTERDKQSSL